MKSTLLGLLVLSQSACAMLALSASRPTYSTTGKFVTRPDSAAAQLTCDGQPCSEIRVSRMTSRLSPWPFVLTAAAEAACTAVSVASRHSGDEIPSTAYACGGLLAVDLAELTLGWAALGHNPFGATISDYFDSRVELTMNGDRAVLRPHSLRVDGRIPPVFSAEAALAKSVSFETAQARGHLCGALKKKERIHYHVYSFDGDEGGLLREAIATQVMRDLGRPSAIGLDYGVETTLSRSGEWLTLEARLMSGERELGRAKAVAKSPEEMTRRVSTLFPDVYGSCYGASAAPGAPSSTGFAATNG